jgi:HlyD family secretion protein
MKKSGKRRLIYGGIGVLVLAGGAYIASNMSSARAEFDPSKLAVVEKGTMVKSVVATGKIEPISKVEIKSKANGIIEQIRVEVGDVVAPGTVLAELDKELLVARLREEEANLSAALAGLTAAEAQLKKNVIEAEGPEVEFARRARDRAENLFQQELVAQSALDDARSAYEVAINRQRSARGQLGVAEARVTEARAKVAQSRAAVTRAQEDLRNATLRSPIQGMVLSRDVEIGSPVSSILNLGANATLVFTLGDIERVFVRGRVDETDIGRVKLGQAAKIRVETFKDKTFDGKVTLISPIGVEKDNVTTFQVEVSIENPGKELKANMTANAEIILEEHPDSVLIPESAVTYDASKKAFVEMPAAAEPTGRKKVEVKLGVGNGTKTQVLSGVKPGDKVILPS